ncbi:PepSY domain-containing protein [Bosea sp. TAB14]|jgi:uncharacterized membrane protein YkoI|uniref:PepSY domain-containing protein n=1 Tax=Bosea sp. TAB14 TaxID=3237481 RepID=UPI003F9193A6
MTMTPVEPLLAFALLASSPAPIVRIDDQAPISCLSSDEMRDAVADGRVIQPAEASRHARHAAPGEVVRIRLCRQGEEFVYVVTTLKRDGKVARVTLEGQSGKVATIR